MWKTSTEMILYGLCRGRVWDREDYVKRLLKVYGGFYYERLVVSAMVTYCAGGVYYNISKKNANIDS